MHHYELFQPHLSKMPVPIAFPEEVRQANKIFEVAKVLSDHEAIWLNESTFRAARLGIGDVIAALRKVQAHAAELVAHLSMVAA